MPTSSQPYDQSIPPVSYTPDSATGASPQTLPYPSRAASLPGTVHYGSGSSGASHQHAGGANRNRGSQTPNFNTSHYPHSVGAPNLLAMPNANFGQNIHPLLMRGSPQLQAQFAAAQQMANGNAMAPSFGANPSQIANPASVHHHSAQQQPAMPYDRYVAELTNCIIAFLSPQLPTEEEYRIKEATRRQLEKIAATVIPGARLLAFGSMANGFALKNSDMDLCCLTANTPAEAANGLPASELVETMAQVLREQTDFHVYALPKARIPIIKISRAASVERPYEVACDIGFENRLALENTRLLLSYAMVDPPRLRTLVLFLKVWTKRRKLNSPFTGTLSSYGYTLLVLYFLCHVKHPSVLPNLQRIPPSRPFTPEETINGHDAYFFDDVTALKKEWQTQNTENVAELLIDFFRYFAKEFAYSRDVISIKTEGGLIPKDGVTWNAELCIEDPFQSGYNVSRTVTKDGLYTIRGEFMRATRILQNRHQRVATSLAELCEEREDVVARAPDTPPPRNRFGSASSMHPPHLTADGRSIRDMYDGQRRGSNLNASGYGGSFAFEEMARGLGRQRGQMAYPTAAMLAPLSQNGGLSPRPRNVGLRGTRDMSTPGRGNNRSSATVPSSARSDDGNGATNFENARLAHASARTSPTFAPAVPHGLPATNDVGEAWAFGSEISFGSERFRLHPSKDKSRQRQQSAGEPEASSSRETKVPIITGGSVPQSPPLMPPEGSNQHRTSRSFSDGVNRSKSLPREADAKEGGVSAAHLNGLNAAMSSLQTNDGQHLGDVSTSSGRFSPTTAGSDAPSQAGTESHMAPMQEYTAAWAQKQLQQQQHESGVGGASDVVNGGFTAAGEDDADDGSDRLSDGVLDELSRISQIEAEGRGRHSRNSSYAEAQLGFGEGYR